MEQLVTEVVIQNKAMLKRVKALLSFVFMQLIFIVALYVLQKGNRSETAGVLLVILVLSCLLMVVRIIAREPWKIVFAADQIKLHYLFVTKTVSSYDLKAIDFLVVEKKPAKQKLVNQHLYGVPYLTIQLTIGDRLLHIVPMYVGANNNQDLPAHRKQLEDFLDRLLQANVLPEVPVTH